MNEQNREQSSQKNRGNKQAEVKKEQNNMPEHIVTGTTEEEREKEIYDYAIKCGWNETRARAYGVFLGDF